MRLISKVFCFCALTLGLAHASFAETPKRLVSSLGPKTEKTDIYEKFGENPKFEIDCLIGNLKVIPKKSVSEDSPDIKVVWSIRALRFLSGQDFEGQPSNDFHLGEREEDRRYGMLKTDTGKMKFFRTWPSRAVVFLAPPATQKEIISQWKKWWQEHRSGFVPAPKKDADKDPSWDDWYY